MSKGSARRPSLVPRQAEADAWDRWRVWRPFWRRAWEWFKREDGES